jgi:putative membrane protein
VSADTQREARGDRRFIERAAESNLKEIAASQLAVERASNEQVRQFAQQIVQDHHRVDSELRQLAQRRGVDIEGAVTAAGHAHHGVQVGARADTRSSGALGAAGAGGATATPPRTQPGAVTGATVNDPQAGRVGQARPAAGAGVQHGGIVQRDPQLRRLAEQRGRDFDERYMRMMVREHENAVRLFERTAESAQDPEIRQFAGRHVNSLRQHLEQARNLQRVVAE